MVAIISLFLMVTAPPGAAMPASIDTLCNPLARYAKQKGHVPRIFADLADPQREKESRWRALRDKAELDRRANESDVDTQAFVWGQDGGTYVMMFFTSPSGDWAAYGDFCYRRDGTLARSVSTLNTFNVDGESDDDAPVSRIRTRYFTADGRLLRSNDRVVNTKTKKPTKVPFGDQDDSLYQTIRQLPFANLLQ